MPSDVKDIMGLSRPAADGPAEQKPKAKEAKAQRPAGMSREAYALLGDSHPITPTALANELNKSDDKVRFSFRPLIDQANSCSCLPREVCSYHMVPYLCCPMPSWYMRTSAACGICCTSERKLTKLMCASTRCASYDV